MTSSHSIISMSELARFLLRAKLATYASGGEAAERDLDAGSKYFEFEVKKSGLKYTDRYFGFNPFGGEEIVYKNGKPVWIMNYYGVSVTQGIVDARQIYSFLRKAMRKVDTASPFRGPKSLKQGAWVYSNVIDGVIGNFRGYETISFKGEHVYRLDYHGGML
jgi:Domain of unknown function (DUF5680)